MRASWVITTAFLSLSFALAKRTRMGRRKQPQVFPPDAGVAPLHYHIASYQNASLKNISAQSKIMLFDATRAYEPLLPTLLRDVILQQQKDGWSDAALSYFVGELQRVRMIKHKNLKNTVFEAGRYADKELATLFSDAAAYIGSQCLKKSADVSPTSCSRLSVAIFANNTNLSSLFCNVWQNITNERKGLRTNEKRFTHRGVTAPEGRHLWRTAQFGAARAAVCIVGVPRTLTRPEHSHFLRHNFLTAWGISTDVFTLLVRPDRRDEERAVTRILDEELFPLRRAWYDPTAPTGKVCGGGGHSGEDHHIAQLRQWAQCFKLVVDEENKKLVWLKEDPGGHGNVKLSRYSLVAKIRPDDFWFGPMLPFCVFDPLYVAYQSAQQHRFSDQFFVIPRQLADDWFSTIEEFKRQGWVNCRARRGHAASLHDPSSNKPNFPFETFLQDWFETSALKHGIKIHVKTTP